MVFLNSPYWSKITDEAVVLAEEAGVDVDCVAVVVG